jgi:hypothetical protein
MGTGKERARYRNGEERKGEMKERIIWRKTELDQE